MEHEHQERYISFDQENKKFLVTSDDGGYHTGTFQDKLTMNPIVAQNTGKLRIAELLQTVGLVALVGNGDNPEFPPNKLFVWSEESNTYAVELEFKSLIRAVRMVVSSITNFSRLIVVTESNIHAYALAGHPERLFVVDTLENPFGVCAVSHHDSVLVAYPIEPSGTVQIDRIEPYQSQKNIAAHTTALRQIALSADGSLLATASIKGTCIRVFNTATGAMLREVRRGSEAAVIQCINFSMDNKRLLVVSNKETHATVHVFSVSEDDSHQNQKSSLFSLRSFLPDFFSSEWSFAQFRSRDPLCKAAFFGDNRHFVVIGNDGNVSMCMIDEKSEGKCREEWSSSYLEK